MPATEIPPSKPVSPAQVPEASDLYDALRWETVYRDLHSVPALVVQLQDDLSRSRRREAFWLSVIFHMTVIILLVNSERLEKYFPHRPVLIVQPNDWMRQKELTYLEQPPDQQKISKRPDTNIISDKNRIATHIDPKELQKILESGRRGTAGTSTPQEQQAPQAAQAPAVQQLQPQQSSPQKPPEETNPNATLRMPQTSRPKPSFSTAPLSAGSAIEQAARAALSSPGSVGEGGDYGLGQGRHAAGAIGPMDVLSDTMGVDFGPYLQRVLHDVRQNWYNIIPEAARPPLMKKGKVSIEFAILKDGRIAGMQLTGTSGDVALDRAAWGGITGSSPFPPLPGEFRGDYLALRFHFYYNPDSTDDLH